MSGDRYDFYNDGCLGDPEGDPQDAYTRQAAHGWYARAIREANERGHFTRIVKCRMCLTNWAPQEYARCYVKPTCRPWRHS